MTEGTLVGKFIVKDIASKLAVKRQRCRDLSDQIDAAEVELKKLPAAQAYEKLHDDLVANQAEEKELEDRLRESALRIAVELETKDPAPGVTVTKKTTFTIDDKEAALEACRESYPQLIEEKIKKPALKKIVVALGEAIKGTTLLTEDYGQVKIATDLSEHYLADEAPF
jgi:hypothetical protein